MNRRGYLKRFAFFSAFGFSSFSIYKLLNINVAVDFSIIRHRKNLLNELAEVIIPRTQTPGAKDADVGEFIIKMLEFCMERKSQNNFVDGLLNLEDYILKRYDKPFIECSASEKVSVLNYLEQEAIYSSPLLRKIRYKLIGKPFFIMLKELTVEGYCTSQIGATRGLAYIYIPGTYNACVPITKNQKSWATK
jgi:hypothetical protein